MSGGSGATVRLGAWDELAASVSPVRFRVFVDEQGVPASLELDEFDALACHALALVGDVPVGTGRLLPVGDICFLGVVG